MAKHTTGCFFTLARKNNTTCPTSPLHHFHPQTPLSTNCTNFVSWNCHYLSSEIESRPGAPSIQNTQKHLHRCFSSEWILSVSCLKGYFKYPLTFGDARNQYAMLKGLISEAQTGCCNDLLLFIHYYDVMSFSRRLSLLIKRERGLISAIIAVLNGWKDMAITTNFL